MIPFKRFMPSGYWRSVLKPEHEDHLRRISALFFKRRGRFEHDRDCLFQLLSSALMRLPSGLRPKHIAPIDQQPVYAEIVKPREVLAQYGGIVRIVFAENWNRLSRIPCCVMRSEPILILNADQRA